MLVACSSVIALLRDPVKFLATCAHQLQKSSDKELADRVAIPDFLYERFRSGSFRRHQGRAVSNVLPDGIDTSNRCVQTGLSSLVSQP